MLPESINVADGERKTQVRRSSFHTLVLASLQETSTYSGNEVMCALEQKLQAGTWLIRVPWLLGLGVIYLSWLLEVPLLPFYILGIKYSYKAFLSEFVRVLCLSVIVTDAPFPSTGPRLSYAFPVVMFRTPAILMRLLQKPRFSAQSQGLPFSSTILLAML